ncbi:MAG: hypothetical protein U1E05_04550, partial [Patescibacteria group bacterium]|nr:hypothetical protein [Patescibacteria group bacterium]
HAKGPMSLREYMVPKSALPDDLGGLYEAAQGVLDRLPTLYVRVAGRLATIAMRVETVSQPTQPASFDG